MSYIFLDESGNLGFDFTKKKTTKFFIVTLLFVKNKKPIEGIVKKTFRSFPKNYLLHHSGVLHCFNERPQTRFKVLSRLSQKDVAIITIYLNKQKVYTSLQDEKHTLYNYVVNILLDRVYTKKLVPVDQPIKLIASRRETNRFLNENFINYLHAQTRLNHKLDIAIEIKSPQEEKSLQVVDFASWAIFRKREYGDESYTEIFKQKIVEENPLFS